MAERGAPLGNDNATKNRLWADTLRRALLAEDGKTLRRLAERLIERAADGDVPALKEIGDRIDGKSKQQIEASGPDGGPLQISQITRTIVDPRPSNT